MSTLSVATLSEIRTIAQQYADMVNSSFVTTAEWNSYINLAYFELYDILIQKYGDDYFATSYNLTTDGTNYQYALPSDFYKLLGVDLQLNNSTDSWTTLKPFMFGERNRFAVPNMQSFRGLTNLRYRVFGSNIFFSPIPTSGQVVRLWYVPRLTELSSDSDTVDGVSGWQEYLCLDAAIKALRKEESDVSMFVAQKQALIQRIESAAAGRDAGNPQTVTDSSRLNDGFGDWNMGW